MYQWCMSNVFYVYEYSHWGGRGGGGELFFMSFGTIHPLYPVIMAVPHGCKIQVYDDHRGREVIMTPPRHHFNYNNNNKRFIFLNRNHVTYKGDFQKAITTPSYTKFYLSLPAPLTYRILLIPPPPPPPRMHFFVILNHPFPSVG